MASAVVRVGQPAQGCALNAIQIAECLINRS